jgi:hypothetical protein
MRSFHLELAKWHWKRHLEPGDVAVDATCGNGHDALFLAKMGLSTLFALDIQATAIEKTGRLLREHLNEEEMQRVVLCRMSHEDLRNVDGMTAPRLIVYNLGYLPGGDKTATTQTESTLASLGSALAVLGKRGAVSITCYPGHGEGMKEEEAVIRFAASLPSDLWEVIHHRKMNRPLAPSLIWIARLDNS